MIIVNCATQQDEVIKILENADGEFKFIKKQGIKLMFETNNEDLDVTIVRAKSIIKDSELGKSLYFQVTK